MPFCDPMDHSPSGSSVHEISQARMLEGVAISFSRVGPASLELALDFFATEPGDVPAPLQRQNSCSICRYLQRLVCVENRKESFSGDK